MVVDESLPLNLFMFILFFLSQKPILSGNEIAIIQCQKSQ